MTIEKMREAEAAARDFLDVCDEVDKRAMIDTFTFYGCKETAALRRASMELSRALSRLRAKSKEVGKMKGGPVENTDVEIWRERQGDFYADSIHVTEGGGIGINCGGMVFVAPVRMWHEAMRKHLEIKTQMNRKKKRGG